MNFLDPRLPDRFWSKCIPEPMSGCWLWTGATTQGRGQLRYKVDGKFKAVHAYRLAVSVEREIGSLHIDHRCENPACVNPAHLDLVTSAENTRRYWQRHPASTTRCPNGHEYAVTGTYRGVGRRPICRACHQAVCRARYERRKRDRRRRKPDPIRVERGRKAWETRRALYGESGRIPA